MKAWEKKDQARLKRIDEGHPVAGDDAPAELPELRMDPTDADNFLKLATALKIIMGRSIRLDDLARAKVLLQEYLRTYLKVHQMISLVYV